MLTQQHKAAKVHWWNLCPTNINGIYETNASFHKRWTDDIRRVVGKQRLDRDHCKSLGEFGRNLYLSITIQGFDLLPQACQLRLGPHYLGTTSGSIKQQKREKWNELRYTLISSYRDHKKIPVLLGDNAKEDKHN